MQNKAVLRAVYDLMFSERDIRSRSPLKDDNAAFDLNRLMLQHNYAIDLVDRLPPLTVAEKHKRSLSGGAKSATNLRSMRRRDSQSIDAAVRLSAEQEKEGN